MPPTSTYRLQLRREFGFRDAAAVVPYLARLGISHVYCSPVLQAAPGSAHGYDVVDHHRLSADLGGDDGWADLVAACRAHALGLVVDVVPNHMAVPVPEELNRAFWDVLRLGPSSPFAGWFDVDWQAHGGRILMPVLAEQLDDCLADGTVVVDPANGVVRYYDHRFPLAPGTHDVRDQHYLLASWRTAAHELNYRRFFDVTSLIGVRVESPEVFDATHARLLELVRAGEVDGLRIDHPDGLADPDGYLERLARETPGVWTTVEKILEGDETLPSSWDCAGTTGYDALRAVTQVLTEPAGAAALTHLYTSLTGSPGFDDVVVEAKRLVVESILEAEVARLVRDLDSVPGLPTDITSDALHDAISALLMSFDVYRAYAGHPETKARIAEAAARAMAMAPHAGAAVSYVASVLDHPSSEAARAFVVRFEQTTGPVMAKGVEDTAFYRYHRLVALNEVGGDPAVIGAGVASWHEECGRRQRDWPASMTTLSTHDTKRSEDVRARLLVLAEIPHDWAAGIHRWRAAAAAYDPPDANTDYLFWQTLVGAWPISLDRMLRYLEKATREAKQHTSWTDPDERWEAGLRRYVERVLAADDLMADVREFVESRLLAPAESNVLAQKLLQLTMPGVPDVYQGQELSELRLVDPDNREPVDYGARKALLRALDACDAVPAKLLVTARTLRARREHPAAFASSYRRLPVHGAAADHAVAYLRGESVAVVATRLPARLAARGGWGATQVDLPDGPWADALTGTPVAATDLASLLKTLPVALLMRQPG